MGIPTVGAVTRSVYNIVKSGVIEIIEQSSRQQLTYYPSHRNEGIVWDAGVVEQKNSDQGVNPLLCEITFPQYTPPIQMNDCLADVHLMHWGFLHALTHRELMLSDPIYRREQNARVAALPGRFDHVVEAGQDQPVPLDTHPEKT